MECSICTRDSGVVIAENTKKAKQTNKNEKSTATTNTPHYAQIDVKNKPTRMRKRKRKS